MISKAHLDLKEGKGNKMKYIFKVVVLGLLIGCGRQHESSDVVNYDPRALLIMKNGELVFGAEPLTEDELVVMVKERVEKDLNSDASSRFATIIVESDSEAPKSTVQRVESLIMKNGGLVAQ